MASTRSSLAAASPLPLHSPNRQVTPQSRYSASLSPAPSSLSELEHDLSPVPKGAPTSSRSPEIQRKRKPSKKLEFGADGTADDAAPKKRFRRTKEQMEQDRQAAIAAGVPEYKAKRPPKVYQQLLQQQKSGEEPKSSRSSSFSEKLSKLRVEDRADGRASPAILAANAPSFTVQSPPHIPPHRLQEQQLASASSPRLESSTQPSIAVSSASNHSLSKYANSNLNDTSNAYTSHKGTGGRPVPAAPPPGSDNMKISDLLSSDKDPKPSQPSRSPSTMPPYQYSQQSRPDDRNIARYNDGTPYNPYEPHVPRDQRAMAQQQYQQDYRGQQQAYGEPMGNLDRAQSSHGYNQNTMSYAPSSSMMYYNTTAPSQQSLQQAQHIYQIPQTQSHITAKPPSPPRSSRAFDPVRSIASTTTHTPSSRPSPLMSTPALQPQSRSSAAPSISNLLDLSPGRNQSTSIDQTRESKFPNMARSTGNMALANDRLRPVEVIDLADDSDVPAKENTSSHRLRHDHIPLAAVTSNSAMDLDVEPSKPATTNTTPESKPKTTKKRNSNSNAPTINNLSRAPSEKPGEESASSETATTTAVPKKRAPVVLPPSLPPLPGQVDLFKSSDPIEDAPCIYLHVPLVDGESNRYVNFAQLAEKTYGFAALHPRIAAQKERLARVAAVGALLEGKEFDGEGMNLDNSDGEDAEMSNMESAREADKTKKKRLTKEDMYDKDDPFVDDTELAWEQAAKASTDGFFVYLGALVQENATVAGNGTGKGEKGESKRARAKTDGKGRTTKKEKEKEKDKEKEEKDTAAGSNAAGAGTPTGKTGAPVGRPKKKTTTTKGENEEPKEKAKRKPKEKVTDTNTSTTPSKPASTSATAGPAKSKEKDATQMDIDTTQSHAIAGQSTALPIVTKQAPSPFDLLGGDTPLASTSGNPAGSSTQQRHPGPSIVDILD